MRISLLVRNVIHLFSSSFMNLQNDRDLLIWLEVHQNIIFQMIYQFKWNFQSVINLWSTYDQRLANPCDQLMIQFTIQLFPIELDLHLHSHLDCSIETSYGPCKELHPLEVRLSMKFSNCFASLDYSLKFLYPNGTFYPNLFIIKFDVCLHWCQTGACWLTHFHTGDCRLIFCSNWFTLNSVSSSNLRLLFYS